MFSMSDLNGEPRLPVGEDMELNELRVGDEIEVISGGGTRERAPPGLIKEGVLLSSVLRSNEKPPGDDITAVKGGRSGLSE